MKILKTMRPQNIGDLATALALIRPAASRNFQKAAFLKDYNKYRDYRNRDKFIIFDEATNALDEENEKLIMKHVMKVYYDNVVFTEDFSNIESFNNIEPITYNKQKSTYVDELMDDIYINNIQNKDTHVIPKILYKTGIEEFENI